MTAVASHPQVADRIFTRDFLLVCFASVGIFSGMAFLMPVLPLYVVHVGGARTDIGMVIAAFALTAVALRPFLGRAVDRRGAKGILAGGAVIMAFASALYLVVPNIPLLLAVRALHGVGMGAATTAAMVLVANYAPPDRRGEAMGYHGMFLSASFALGPLAGIALHQAGGFVLLFSVLTVITALSLALVVPLREVPKEPDHLTRKPGPLFARSAFLPAIVFFCMATTFAPIASFLPLLVEDREFGAATTGIFFSLQAGAIFLSRIFGGRLSDRYGRVVVVLPSLAIIVAGMAVLAFASFPAMLFLAAVVHGFGVGSLQPALLAMAVDRAPEQERGATLATVTSAMDLGVGIMAVPLGMLLEATDFTTTFLAAGSVALMGMVVFGFASGRSGILHRSAPSGMPAS